MSFFRPLSKTAPEFDRRLPWPIDGLAYVAMFMSPIAAGPLVGALTFHWGAAGVGLLIGICISCLNGWLTDRFIEPWIGRNQGLFQPRTCRVLANGAAFSWAFLLGGVSMFTPLALFSGS